MNNITHDHAPSARALRSRVRTRSHMCVYQLFYLAVEVLKLQDDSSPILQIDHQPANTWPSAAVTKCSERC